MDIFEKITFRKLNDKDKDLFVSLRMVYLNEEFDINEKDKEKIINSLNTYYDKHNKNDFIGIIAEIDKKIVSVAYLAISEKPANPSFINGKIGTLLNVYTYPEFRKKGIATKLIEKIIEEGKKINVSSIELKSTEAGNKLYKNLGFTEGKHMSMSKKL